MNEDSAQQPFTEQKQNENQAYLPNLMPINIPKGAKNLSRDILLGPVNLKKPPQFHRGILEAMTHLKMSQQKLSSVTAINLEDQEEPLLAVHCPNL